MRRQITPDPPTNPPGPDPIDLHDHEWEPVHSSPIIEDGAAIFREECRWAETKSVDMGKYGSESVVVGAECEEYRTYRMEAAWAEKKMEDSPSIFYLASEFDHFWRVAEQALIAVEQDGGEIISIDPDGELGQVTIETDNWRVKFKADCTPQIDPPPRY